ncbi:unnamed protein product [Coregonus sp. 'balchen']|nr:unnamed protein product [Coregonus sp. 'balchen']
MDSYHDYDYCAVLGSAAVDLVLIEREEMQREIEDLRNKVEELTVVLGCSDLWDQMHRSSPSQDLPFGLSSNRQLPILSVSHEQGEPS